MTSSIRSVDRGSCGAWERPDLQAAEVYDQKTVRNILSGCSGGPAVHLVGTARKARTPIGHIAAVWVCLGVCLPSLGTTYLILEIVTCALWPTPSQSNRTKGPERPRPCRIQIQGNGACGSSCKSHLRMPVANDGAMTSDWRVAVKPRAAFAASGRLCHRTPPTLAPGVKRNTKGMIGQFTINVMARDRAMQRPARRTDR